MFRKHQWTWFPWVLVTSGLLLLGVVAPSPAQKGRVANITFLSGSMTIDNNNNYVITWKIANPEKVAVRCEYQLTGLPEPEKVWRNGRADWGNPATNTCHLNVGTGPKATGVVCRFYVGDKLVLENKTFSLSQRKKASP